LQHWSKHHSNVQEERLHLLPKKEEQEVSMFEHCNDDSKFEDEKNLLNHNGVVKNDKESSKSDSFSEKQLSFETIPQEELLRCDTCNYSSNSVRNLKRHIDAIHMKIKDFICQWCAAPFVCKKSLSIHIKSGKYIHSDGTEKMLCTMYTKKRVDIFSGQIHYTPESKDYTCVNCKTVTSTMDEAVGHYEEKHPLKGYLICKQCSHKFKARLAFREHLANCSKQEEEESLFDCKFCDSKFSVEKDFQHHVRAIHSNELRFRSFLKKRKSEIKTELKFEECDYSTSQHSNNLESKKCISSKKTSCVAPASDAFQMRGHC
jgi:RNase P subunit RPR2